MADLRRNSGLKTEVVDQILKLFPELSDLTPGNKANPPLNEWGSDDWLAFINEYTKNQKSSADRSKSIEALRKNLSESIKQSSRGDGRFGLEAAQIRMRAREEAAKASMDRERAAKAAWYRAQGLPWEDEDTAGNVANQKRAVANQKSYDANNGEGGWGVPAGVGQAPMTKMAAEKWTTKKSKTYSGNVNISTNMNRSAKSLTPMMAVKGYAGQGYGGNNGQGMLTKRMKEKEATKKMKAEVGMAYSSNGNMAMGVPAGVPTKAMAMRVAGVPTKAMGVAGMGMPAGVGQGVSVGEMKQGPTAGPPMDITPLVTALSTINNTLIGSLASIESRAKKNDINPALVNMNDFLSQINASLPMPTQGGGPAMAAASPKIKTKQSGFNPTAKKKSKSKSKSTPKSAANAGTPPLAAEVPGTIGGVITVLSQINTTLQTSLAAIETRLTKNDINPALETMNDYLSQINDSIPMPAEGGGTRRSRMKKRKQTLRHRRA